MNHTSYIPKRLKPTPTFTIPALLALAGFTIVGLILVETERTQVSAWAEAPINVEAPSFPETQPGPASPPASKPKVVRAKPTPAYSFTAALALEAVRPDYPRIAKLTRVQGPVEVNLRVDAKGRPVQATVLSGNSMLQGEALKAAQGWKFAPAHENGRAVPSDFRIRFEFRLA